VSDRTGAEEVGGDRAGMITFGDLESALQREVEIVAERFPSTDATVVEQTVRDVFAELRNDANVEAHLLAVTRNEAISRLEAQGQSFEPATLTADPAVEAQDPPG
jgi:hypothetical protein